MKAVGGSLDADRRLLDALLPGLPQALSQWSLGEIEQPRGPGIDAFRRAKGPRLLVPVEHKGFGRSAVEAVRVQRALGSLAPSLAVATTMHHFSVATLVEMAAGNASGLEWVLMQAIAQEDLLVASGFAEGHPGQHVFEPRLRGRREGDVIVVTGSKKPCSLAWSMDLLTASVLVDEGDGRTRLAVVTVPAKMPGVAREPFWSSPILAGAESDKITLTDVRVPDRLVIYPAHDDMSRDRQHARGFIWFEVLISASYVGIASALFDRVLTSGRGTPAERVDVALELEGARHALLNVAVSLDSKDAAQADLAQALLVRYSVQRAVIRAAAAAAECCGGIQFVSSGDISYLLAASRALAYHPPSLGATVPAMDDHLRGTDFGLKAKPERQAHDEAE